MWVGSLSERKPVCHVIHPQGMAVITCTHAGFASPVQEAGPVIMDLPKENQGNQSVPSPQKCVSVRVRQAMLCNKQPPHKQWLKNNKNGILALAARPVLVSRRPLLVVVTQKCRLVPNGTVSGLHTQEGSKK